MIEPLSLIVGGAVIAAVSSVRLAKTAAIRREEQRRLVEQLRLQREAADARRQIRDHTRSAIDEMVTVASRRAR